MWTCYDPVLCCMVLYHTINTKLCCMHDSREISHTWYCMLVVCMYTTMQFVLPCTFKTICMVTIRDIARETCMTWCQNCEWLQYRCFYSGPEVAILAIVGSRSNHTHNYSYFNMLKFMDLLYPVLPYSFHPSEFFSSTHSSLSTPLPWHKNIMPIHHVMSSLQQWPMLLHHLSWHIAVFL